MVDRRDDGAAEAAVLVATNHTSDREGDVCDVQAGGCDLVQQRLERLVVVTVDQRDVHRRLAQGANCPQSGEAAPMTITCGRPRSPSRELRSIQADFVGQDALGQQVGRRLVVSLAPETVFAVRTTASWPATRPDHVGARSVILLDDRGDRRTRELAGAGAPRARMRSAIRSTRASSSYCVSNMRCRLWNIGGDVPGSCASRYR